jgi:hypothetical protein
MRRASVFLFAVVVGISLMMVGCSKEPLHELAVAKAALDSAKAYQADKYAAPEYSAVQDSLAAAIAEIQKQKTSGHNFTNAKKTLVSVKTAAAQLKSKAAEGKAIAQGDADNAIAKLNSSIAEAKTLLGKQPKTKKNKARLEGKQKQVSAVEASVAEIQKLRESGDFIAARDQAKAGTAKIDEIKSEFKSPVAKPTKAKAKKKRK